MKGEIILKDEKWYVKYPDCEIPNVGRFCEQSLTVPIHQDTMDKIIEYSRVFDNINARILSNPKVDFDLVKVQNQEYARINNI